MKWSEEKWIPGIFDQRGAGVWKKQVSLGGRARTSAATGGGAKKTRAELSRRSGVYAKASEGGKEQGS